MIEELKQNVAMEAKMAVELQAIFSRMDYASTAEINLMNEVINSMQKRIKILNNSIPELLKDVSLAQKLYEPAKGNIAQLSLGRKKSEVVAINVKDKNQFLKEVRISEDLIKKLKKRKVIPEATSQVKRRAGMYARLSNSLFLGISNKWIARGNFQPMLRDLRKSNLNVLGATYISMMIFTTILSFFVGILAFAFFMTFSVSPVMPIITAYSGSYLTRFLNVSWLIIAVPLITALSLYFYPGTERKSLAKRIDQELPFVVVHMGSISGSGIEPLEIFKIIGLGKEYPYTGKEVAKLVNQINLYGYDLVTALVTVSKTTPSLKLAELLSGLATTINTGGDMKLFFEKRAETLIVEYRLEREKFTKIAETFMDIYISVIIATPMILLLLLIMISVSGASVGLGITQMTVLIILLVAGANMLFLFFLHLKQPSY